MGLLNLEGVSPCHPVDLDVFFCYLFISISDVKCVVGLQHKNIENV